MKRKILVMLSNRVDPNFKVRHVELECDDKGNILQEKKLRRVPREARFDEVWENDEGRQDVKSCFRFKRKYGHRLEKKANKA